MGPFFGYNRANSPFLCLFQSSVTLPGLRSTRQKSDEERLCAEKMTFVAISEKGAQSLKESDRCIKRRKEPVGLINQGFRSLELEARAGVEPTYTDLQA